MLIGQKKLNRKKNKNLRRVRHGIHNHITPQMTKNEKIIKTRRGAFERFIQYLLKDNKINSDKLTKRFGFKVQDIPDMHPDKKTILQKQRSDRGSIFDNI